MASPQLHACLKIGSALQVTYLNSFSLSHISTDDSQDSGEKAHESSTFVKYSFPCSSLTVRGIWLFPIAHPKTFSKKLFRSMLFHISTAPAERAIHPYIDMHIYLYEYI